MKCSLRIGHTVLVALTCMLLGSGRAEGIDIQFDYSKDTTGFFVAGSEGRRVLEAAAAYYELLLNDGLGALIPSGVNTLTVDFLDPSKQVMVEIVPPPIPANTMLIFVGAANLSGGNIGYGFKGGIYPYGTNAWLNYVDTRGQVGIVYGPGANEVAPWGGSLTVDTLDEAGAPRPWDYSYGVKPGNSGLHLYSLLIHELAHVLGFGTCDAWRNRIDTAGKFMGAQSVVTYGARIPLDSDRIHWAQGTQSTVYGTIDPQETALDPVLAGDSVSLATKLDMAALRDIGWQVGAALPAPILPSMGTAMTLNGQSFLLSWKGSTQYQYTLLGTTNLARWSAIGATIPGISGSMQVSLPANGTALGYRLLVENRVVSAQGFALELFQEVDAPDGEAATRGRSREGAGATRRDGEPPVQDSHWCGRCVSGQTSPVRSLLRAKWARLSNEP